MNFRPNRSHIQPPTRAPPAAPKALALSAASSPTAKSSTPNSCCHSVRLTAIAMIDPASM
jgi:hypothetical protein